MLKTLKRATSNTLIKTRKMSQSSNFWTNLTSLILSFLIYLGIEVSPTLPGEIVDAVQTVDITAMIMIVVNLVNKIIHIWEPEKIKEEFWAFLKSTNFYTNLITLLIGIVIFYGAAVPDNAVSELVDSILGGDLGLILSAVAINIINPIYHLLFKKD